MGFPKHQFDSKTLMVNSALGKLKRSGNCETTVSFAARERDETRIAIFSGCENCHQSNHCHI